MALKFNGSTDYVDAGNSALLQPAAISVSCWVNLNSLAPAYTTLVSNDGNATFLYQLFVKSNGKLAIYIVDSTGSTGARDGDGTAVLSTGIDYHVAFTMSAGPGIVGYVNGVADSSIAIANGLGAATASHTTLGTDLANGGRLLGGSLSDVAIYNSALSASQVALLASGISPLAVSPHTLAGYWPLSGQSPTADRGPNGLLAAVLGPSPATDPPFLIPYPRRILASNFAEGEMPALFTSAGFLAAWAKQSNLPVLGTGIY